MRRFAYVCTVIIFLNRVRQQKKKSDKVAFRIYFEVAKVLISSTQSVVMTGRVQSTYKCAYTPHTYLQ